VVQAGIADFRRGRPRVWDDEDAGCRHPGLLVFMQRFELDQNNGRRKGRAFLDALSRIYANVPGAAPPVASSSLILPEAATIRVDGRVPRTLQ